MKYLSYSSKSVLILVDFVVFWSYIDFLNSSIRLLASLTDLFSVDPKNELLVPPPTDTKEVRVSLKV